MFACILTIACAAPVPTHLMKPSSDPIVPGYRWNYLYFELEVTRVEGETVWFRCTNCPERTWPCTLEGVQGDNCQSKKTVRDESARYGVPWRPPTRLWFDP